MPFPPHPMQRISYREFALPSPQPVRRGRPSHVASSFGSATILPAAPRYREFLAAPRASGVRTRVRPEVGIGDVRVVGSSLLATKSVARMTSFSGRCRPSLLILPTHTGPGEADCGP